MALPPIAIVQFPDQQQILDYIIAHPGRPILDALPTAMQDWNLISKTFANKVMPRGEIEQNIKAVLLTDKKVIDFTVSVEKIVKQLDDIDGPDPILKWNAQGLVWTEERALRAYLQIYYQFLDDFVSKAAFIPPKEGNNYWTREVCIK